MGAEVQEFDLGVRFCGGDVRYAQPELSSSLSAGKTFDRRSRKKPGALNGEVLAEDHCGQLVEVGIVVDPRRPQTLQVRKVSRRRAAGSATGFDLDPDLAPNPIWLDEVDAAVGRWSLRFRQSAPDEFLGVVTKWSLCGRANQLPRFQLVHDVAIAAEEFEIGEAGQRVHQLSLLRKTEMRL